MYNTLITEAKTIVLKVCRVYWTLIKVMVPALLIVKLLESLGAIYYLSLALTPVMAAVGLPAEMGIVWATAMLVNIYTAMAVFFAQTLAEPLSVAQITVLSSMILFSHALLVEGAIAKAAGLGWTYTLLLRLGGALVVGLALHHGYTSLGLFQQASTVMWQPNILVDSWQAWLMLQLQTLLLALFIITALIVTMRVLEYLGIEQFLHWLLTPFLRVLGIGKEAANITVVGITLGLSFGGGLLIEQAKSGNVSKRNVLLAMSFLSLSHSLIEDTLLMMLLGANLSGILLFRLLFSFFLIAIIARYILPEPASQ